MWNYANSLLHAWQKHVVSSNDQDSASLTDNPALECIMECGWSPNGGFKIHNLIKTYKCKFLGSDCIFERKNKSLAHDS